MTMDSDMMRAFEERMETLAEKHVGKDELLRGRSIPDRFLRIQWYVKRIYQLGSNEGSLRFCLRRCKRTDSPIAMKYSNLMLECEHVREHLMFEFSDMLMAVK